MDISLLVGESTELAGSACDWLSQHMQLIHKLHVADLELWQQDYIVIYQLEQEASSSSLHVGLASDRVTALNTMTKTL
jgi:hypothetical protein